MKISENDGKIIFEPESIDDGIKVGMIIGKFKANKTSCELGIEEDKIKTLTITGSNLVKFMLGRI